MVKQILLEKRTYYTLVLWLISGIISPWLSLAIIPIHIISLNREYEKPIVFIIGLWLILTFSDSFQASLSFAKTIKPFVILVLAWIVYQNNFHKLYTPFHKPFTVFFLIALYCIINAPYTYTSIQKTLSYFLIIFVTSGLCNYYICYHKVKFLTHIILCGSIILSLGIALKYAYPPFVTFMGTRFSGMFGNPNGLGMYTFLFLMLFTSIIHYHPNLFSKYQRYIIYFLIVLSLYWAGSRGGIFASILFLIGYRVFLTSRVAGIISMLSLIISYQLVINNLEFIITSLGLQEYFRLETLETGSGRNIAFDFAWQHIQLNYYLGLGFGYAENLMKDNQEYFASIGHIGNVHNSYLTIWLDTGLVGLVAFSFAWIKQFWEANKYSFLAGAILFAVLFSSNVESWLAGSLNPFTIQLIMILTMLSNPNFYKTESQLNEE